MATDRDERDLLAALENGARELKARANSTDPAVLELAETVVVLAKLNARLMAARKTAAPTPDGQKGIFRNRGATLLDNCICLMERMFMESLNGVLCQFEDGDRRPEGCDSCRQLWLDLTVLIKRYDSGER